MPGAESGMAGRGTFDLDSADADRPFVDLGCVAFGENGDDQRKPLQVFEVRPTRQHDCRIGAGDEREGTRERSVAARDMVETRSAFRDLGRMRSHFIGICTCICGDSKILAKVVGVCRLRDHNWGLPGDILLVRRPGWSTATPNRYVCQRDALRGGGGPCIERIAWKAEAERCYVKIDEGRATCTPVNTAMRYKQLIRRRGTPSGPTTGS
jgi:hypothetical protein